MKTENYIENIDHDTQKKALEQCAASLRKTLFLTPFGWGLVAWLSYGHIPVENIATWVLIFSSQWVVSHWRLFLLQASKINNKKLSFLLITISVTDGMAWGAMVPLLFLHNELVDSWLVVVLCGVAAINAPVYVTCMPAFRFFIIGIWIFAVPSALQWGSHVFAAKQFSIGITVYFLILHYNMNLLSGKVIQSIRLQLENNVFATNLAQSLKDFEILANQDALTSLANRRSLNLMLSNLQQRRNSDQMKSCLIMLDIDFFKKINDIHGHSVGDQVLCLFGQRVQENLRSSDTLSRYGGEEFIALLPDTDLEVALDIAERIRKNVEQHELMSNPLISITVSIGVSELEKNISTDDMLNKVDACLYAAKGNGRNQVWFSVDNMAQLYGASLSKSIENINQV